MNTEIPALLCSRSILRGQVYVPRNSSNRGKEACRHDAAYLGILLSPSPSSSSWGVKERQTRYGAEGTVVRRQVDDPNNDSYRARAYHSGMVWINFFPFGLITLII